MCALQVLRRGKYSLLQVVRTCPNCASFPSSLLNALQERIDTWLRPMYGCRSESAELGILSAEDLQGGQLPCPKCCVDACSALVVGTSQLRGGWGW